ncbi:MAG: ATP-grasp domain-containing protein [Methyloprofundus sp.]|nr:ATP-grasp domain-containing protein [Methyloprofundus sp.]MDT8424807.1 ATP-grasp domain-containing protein [Methyloprofundus sp.]
MLDCLLVIANSGRMLAELACKAHYKVIVVDLFADQDTRAMAEQVFQVESLALAEVRSAVALLSLNFELRRVVYGSGLEDHQDTLLWLAKTFQLVGNKPEIFERFRDKKTFFRRLDEFSIQYPESRFSPPEDANRWLVKPIDHVGGIGIRESRQGADADEYYQRFCLGQVGSVLFCADGQQVQLIGFHRQWSINQDNFTFAGIIRDQLLPEIEQDRVADWLERLVSYYHLQGLGSLDFIWDERRCYFLEVNLRPPASVMLYPELDLISAHILGQLLTQIKDSSIRAMQIVYMPQDCQLKSLVQWPEWSFDRSENNACIQAGQPICSIMAHGKTVQQTLVQLLDRQKIIENTILN